VIQLTGEKGVAAIGVMNRDSGLVEERLEVFSPKEKRVVNNVVDDFIYADNHETKVRQNDWQSTLFKRGFEQIVDHFISGIQSGAPFVEVTAILRTHKICEEIVRRLEDIN
jgi:virulence factor